MSCTLTIGSHWRKQRRVLPGSARRVGVKPADGRPRLVLVVGAVPVMNGDGGTQVWYVDGCGLHTKVVGSNVPSSLFDPGLGDDDANDTR